ncbi:LysR family transcriptional regulator [Pararhodobacter zhoushanensis]|uniref:LysR family transcriptional regulator n=1 Tax=Pararhodobacter zhoushanensis TaxID=2479545 RepID=UPI000F8C8C46|nr:LysR family transcriptional regulator [Pararhodobacter zhoushanensis]
MNITLRQFEVLVTVADTGSFTVAAEQLGVSQPSVSETIRRIETELGFPVFHRTTRRLTASHDGTHVIASARELIRTMQFTYDTILARMGGETSRISLAALPSLISSILAPALSTFGKSHAKVAVEVHDSNQERALALVSDGIADMAFVSQGSLRHDLTFETLAADRFFLLCPADHPLAGRSQVCWADLAKERFIALTPTSSVRKVTDAAFLQANALCVPHYELEQVPSVAAMVQARLGVAALPEYSFSMFPRDHMVAVPLVAPEMVRRIGVVTRRNRPLAPSALAFIDQCRKGVARAGLQEPRR